jgi:AcrR family transcriptional regulator
VRTVDPVRHAARRAAIQDAAATVFAERGYTGATTSQICRAAGVGSGTLFHYFGDKRSIMLSIIVDDQAVNDAMIATLDPEHALREVGRLLDHLCRDAADPYAPGLVGAMLQLAVNDEEFAGILDEGDRRVRDAFALLLTRAADDGDVDEGIDPARASRWLCGLVDALYLMCGDDGFDAGGESRELRRIVARYLGADPLDLQPER